MKISQWGLNFILAADLDGEPIFEELLSRVSLQADGDGNVPDYQVDNIKTTLKVALRLSAAGDGESSGKLRRALMSLLDYGTDGSSDDIRQFLESPESRRPLIVTDLPADSDYLRIGEVLLPLVKGEGGRVGREGMDTFDMFMQRVVQNFSAQQ